MDVQTYMQGVGKAARAASRAMAKADTKAKDRALLSYGRGDRLATRRSSSRRTRRTSPRPAQGASNAALIDRLTLTAKGVQAWPTGCARSPPCPTRSARSRDLNYRPSGIQVGRMRVPLGVIGIIYEARPNVTADAAGLCLKAGNAAILRGGSEAIHSNQAIAACVREGLRSGGPARRRGAGGRDHRPRRGGRAPRHERVRGRHRAARRQGADRAHHRPSRASR